MPAKIRAIPVATIAAQITYPILLVLAIYEVILSRLKSGSIRGTTELFLLHAATAS